MVLLFLFRLFVKKITNITPRPAPPPNLDLDPFKEIHLLSTPSPPSRPPPPQKKKKVFFVKQIHLH